MIEALLLLILGGSTPRPAEDSTFTLTTLAVSYHVARQENDDAHLVFEPRRNYTFIGTVGDDTECSYGVTWTRRTGEVTPFEVSCP